jgi:sulfatase-like protein
MTDHHVDLTGTRAAPVPSSAKPSLRLQSLSPRAVWAIAAATALVSVVHSWMVDGQLADVLFVTGVTLTIGALLVLASQRVLTATVLVAAIMILLRTIAVQKQEATDVVLHAYDVVTFVSSWSAITAFWQEHRVYAVALLTACVAIPVLGWVAFRLDSTRVRRAHGLAAVAIFVALAGLGASLKDISRHTAFYYEERYLSFWLSSWPDTLTALWRGHLIDAARNAPGAPLKPPAVCTPASKPPHIVLIHQESVVPPHYFPTVAYDKRIDPLFRSFDGKTHKLRVETYGGASWLTEFSVLTGLSPMSMGGLRQFAQTIMAHRVRDTLPQALARCGYRNIAIHPMLRIYLSIGRFFDAVGFHQMFDAKDQGAESPVERDHFYYSSALAELERHLKASSRPLFAFIETMATHGPYSYTYMPEVNVPGGGPGTTPEMHEYLRRLAMSHQDYAFLRAELSRRFPGEQFLIVQYGDHQPLATLPLLGFRDDLTIEDVMQSGNEAALITYYAVDAIRYRPPPLPDLETVDVSYLGPIILDAARLPLSDTHRERKRLMAACKGRYHGCPDVLEFNRRLIDSGVVDAL